MKITVTTNNGQIYPLELDGELDIGTVKIILEAEAGMPIDQITLWAKGEELTDDSKTLDGCKVVENDVLYLTRKGTGRPEIGLGSIWTPGQQPRRPTPLEEAQQFINELKIDPYQMSTITQNFPELAAAARENDAQKVADLIKTMNDNKRAADDERRELYRRVAADPFDVEAQKKIEEIIRQENVSNNMMQAMEHNPEAFGSVCMLYIECEVNKHPVKAFVDSGAQMTLMSPSCAERCGIMRLVDQRWTGIAKGVGQAKIVGRVHMVDIKIGSHFLPCSFTILENQDVDMLLGLDMLKRHQCCIDLKRNVLQIGTSADETPFLSEKDLPANAKGNREPEKITEDVK
eukprot:Ihof_evm8s156 gene=Ihof_evmTU8s156